MRFLACLGLLAIAACNSRQPANQTAVATKPAVDPWATPDGSGATPLGGSAEPIPTWAHDSPGVLRDKINGVNSHVVVLKSSASFAEYRDVLASVERTAGVITAQAFIFAELEISKAGKPAVSVALKGVDPGRVGRVLTIGKHMKTGTLDSLGKGESPSIILGDVLARTLGVSVGDDVTVSPIKGSTGIAAASGSPIVFRVTGTFHMGFDEYDERLAFAPLSAVQAIIGRGDQVMGVEMTVKDLDHSDQLAKAIEDSLGGPPYQVMDWYDLNKRLFTALYGERRPRMNDK